MLSNILAVCIGILFFLFLIWIKFKWWEVQLSPRPTINRNLVFGLTGFRQLLRIVFGLLTIIVGVILILTSYSILGIGVICLGVFTLVLPLMVGM